MSSEDLRKFKENNIELAKALVDHKRTICDLKTKVSYHQRAYFEAYDENQVLKARLDFATKTIVDLFKVNTKSYTEALIKLGIVLPTNNPGCKKDLPNASQHQTAHRRNSLDRATNDVTEPAVPEKSSSEVQIAKTNHAESNGQKTSTSNAQQASDKRPNS